MKIFVSYSRADGGEFAGKVYDYFKTNSHDVFTDVNNINAGDPWSKVIEENISTSDIFIVILTFAALSSGEVEREVLQAQRERKKIVPAKYKNIRFDEVPWNLNTHQGIEFESKDEIVTRLYEKIFHRAAPQPKQKRNFHLYHLLLGIIIIVIYSIVEISVEVPPGVSGSLIVIGLVVLIVWIIRVNK